MGKERTNELVGQVLLDSEALRGQNRKKYIYRYME